MSQAPVRESFRDVKFRIQSRVIQDLDPKLDLSNQVEVRRQIEEIFGKVIDEEGLALTRAERVRMLEQITDEIIGLGPLEPLLRDESISEVMVNGPRQVYIERSGKLELTNVVFQNDDHVMRIIDRIIAPIGRRVDESSPMVDARLTDGSRVNAIIPPLSLVGPVITIRKFSASPFTVDDLIRFGTATPDMFDFLRACVEARLNIFVSGGTGSGKTTTLNVLSSFIPNDERIVTIEDAAELQLRQEHVVTLESRPPNIEGKGAIPIRELVRNSLRMRPDRIIVGECRSGEALDMLQAMNTGHDGSMSTGHANSPRDMLSRLETMVLMAGVDLPVRAIREQVASAVDLIVQQSRLKDGTRRIVNITEVQGMEGDVIVMQDVFVFEQTGVVEGKIQGRLKPTGIRPKFVEKFEVMGINLPPGLFGFTLLGREGGTPVDPMTLAVAGVAAAGDLPDRRSASPRPAAARASAPASSATRRRARSKADAAAGQGGIAEMIAQSVALAQLNRVVEQRDFGANLARDIARADLKLKPSEFLAIWAASIVGVPLAVHRLLARPAGPAQPARPARRRVHRLLAAAVLARPPQERPPRAPSTSSCRTRSPCSPTPSAPARRSSRPSSSSCASRGRRSRPSSAGSSARSTSACRSSRRWRTWSAASGRTTSS